MVETGALDQVTQQFIHAFQQDGQQLTHVAKGIFVKLVLIQLTITALWMSVAGENLQRLFLKLLHLSVGFGILYACINYGSTWIPQVLNGFIEIGQQAGVSSIDPSSVIDQGVGIAGGILHAFFNWGVLGHPFVSFTGAVVCIAIMVIYALLAAELAIVLVKSYVLVSFSSLFFAFGGTSATRPMTINYFKTVIGIGLQLMSLYFLLGVGQNLGQTWAHLTQHAAEQHLLMPMLVILAGVIVYYMIVKNIPPFVAGMSGVGGFKTYGATSTAMAIQAGVSGASHFNKAAQLSGGAMQGLGQTGQAFGMGKQSGKFAPAHIAHAAWKSAQDGMMKRNTDLSFGQRLNQHLANRVNNSGGN